MWLRNVYLVVTDLEAVRNILLQRGVKVGAIRYKTPLMPGTEVSHPGATRNHASFADFSDPDGNSGALRERGCRNM